MPLVAIAEVTPAAIITTGLSLLLTALMFLNPLSIAGQVVIGLLLGVFGWALYMSLEKANAVRDAPVERVVAVIVKERVDLRRRLGDGRDTQRTYALVQTRDGERREYFVSKHAERRYAVDDIGIAYVKADVLIDFLRIDV
ncbi:MAG TPA: hypothetical protein VMZ53_04040 [Kofleriaceae bacterium]|nr:hypothetical protein [Kofleriaceae bacterium]